MCSKGIQKSDADTLVEARPALALSTRSAGERAPFSRRALVLICLAFVLPRPASSHSQTTPLLLGGDVPRAPREVRLDPRLPTGERRTGGDFERDRANSAESRTYSPRYPVSVGASAEAKRQRALALLEDAYEAAWLAHGAAPRAGFLHWALEDPEQTSPLRDRLPRISAERLPSLGADRARPICRGGIVDETSAHTCVLEALVIGVSPGSARTLARGYSAFARFASATELPEGLTALLRKPGRPLVTSDPSLSPSASSALFFAALTEQAGSPFTDVGFLALTLPKTRTPPSALRWNAEPDVLDVLRASLGDDRERYARFFDRLGAARFVSLPGLEAISALQGGPAKPAWTVPIESLPRNLTLTEPLWPTGSAAFELVSSSPIASPIAFRIDCESPVTYAWSVVRLSKDEQILSHFPIPYQESSPRMDQRIEAQGAYRLLLVGTNLGGVDLDHPYDPDHAPHEPHGCSVYITRAP